MSHKNIPNIFKCLLSDTCIDKHDILGTSDGFYMVCKSIANILATKGCLIVLQILPMKTGKNCCKITI